MTVQNAASPPLAVRQAAPFLHLPNNSRLGDASPLPPPETRGAVFLDRDGVLVKDVHFLVRPDQLQVLPGVASALRDLQRTSYVVVVSNQSGIARGYLTEDDLLAVHTELVRLFAGDGVIVDALYYCPHLPEAPVAAYATECDCRKPAPGMILRALADWDLDASDSVMVGDSPRDVEAARRAGIPGILIARNGLEESGAEQAVAGLPEVAALVPSIRSRRRQGGT